MIKYLITSGYSLMQTQSYIKTLVDVGGVLTGNSEIHVGDIGLVFQITLKTNSGGVIDLSGATGLEYHFQKPDGTILVVTPSFYTDGTDGILVYASVSGDFDQSGSWRYQVKCIFGTNVYWSDVAKFKVYPNLPIT